MITVDFWEYGVVLPREARGAVLNLCISVAVLRPRVVDSNEHCEGSRIK